MTDTETVPAEPDAGPQATPSETVVTKAAEKEEDKTGGEESTTGTAVDAEEPAETATSTAPPLVSSSKRSRPPYKYDPNKITLRFLFANRDGLTVTVECKPADTVSEVKGALLSVWPEGKVLRRCRLRQIVLSSHISLRSI